MDKLWQWLMRANARAVFIVSLGALLLATGWWVREEIRARDEPLMSVSTQPAAPIDKQPVRLTVLDDVQRQLGFDPSWVPETPFRPAVGEHRRRPDEPRTGETSTAGVRPPRPFGPRPRGGEEEPIDLPPGEPPRPGMPGHRGGDDHLHLVALVYRGLFTRSDGTQMALIEDIERGRRRFHHIGSELYGLRLQSVDTGGIRILTAEGDTLDLPLGQTMHFSEGNPLP